MWEPRDVGVPHIMVTPDQHDSISSPISTSCPPAHPSQDEGFRPRAGTWSSRQRHVSSGAHGTYGSSQIPSNKDDEDSVKVLCQEKDMLHTYRAL
ncbi:unnamed protein product [Cyprideis torosa]|uniref:Uncharacterized protein n=1 Tax=Cyprideis torosa TaxID=163714 RepID=A0A7R8ZGZ2_9CRUS|nr:unnamed protein product [Cyprideis torosa]CAG0881406.1 unnamed protein product [Cyprideis torosa]